MLRRTKEGVRNELSVPRREEMTREFILSLCNLRGTDFFNSN